MITTTAKDIFIYAIEKFMTAWIEGFIPLFKGVGALIGLITIPIWYLPVWIWAKTEEPKYIKRLEEKRKDQIDRLFRNNKKESPK